MAFDKSKQIPMRDDSDARDAVLSTLDVYRKIMRGVLVGMMMGWRSFKGHHHHHGHHLYKHDPIPRHHGVIALF